MFVSLIYLFCDNLISMILFCNYVTVNIDTYIQTWELIEKKLIENTCYNTFNDSLT